MLGRRITRVRNISANLCRSSSGNLATLHLAVPREPAPSHVPLAQTPSSFGLQSMNGCSARHTAHALPHNNLVLSNAQRKTIYALSTPPGKAGVAVIRISGPDALQVWHRMVRTRSRARQTENRKCHSTEERVSHTIGSEPSLPTPWKLERCHIVDSESGELLDDGLVVFFRGRQPNTLLVYKCRTNIYPGFSFYRSQVFHHRRRPGTAHTLWPCHHLLSPFLALAYTSPPYSPTRRVHPSCIRGWKARSHASRRS